MTLALNEALEPLSQELKRELSGITVACKASMLFFTVIILPPALGPISNRVEWKPRQKSLSISWNVAHDQWLRSDRDQRLKLLVGALLDGLESAPPTVLHSDEVRALQTATQRAGSRLLPCISPNA